MNPRNLMTIEWGSVSPGTRTSPAAGRNDDISHRFLSGPDCADERSSQRQERLAGLSSCARARTADRGLPIPAESRPRGSAGLACHASESMRSREDLDDLDTADSHRIEESMSLENPGVVVRARLNTSCVGRPAGAADRLGSWSSPSRALWPSGAQERGLSIATTAGRFAMTMPTACLHVKWPWSARTRRSSVTATSKPLRFAPTSTSTHTATYQSMPHPVPLGLWLSTEALTDTRLPSARPPLCGRTQWPARYPDPAGAISELWSCKMRTARPGRSTRSAADE